MQTESGTPDFSSTIQAAQDGDREAAEHLILPELHRLRAYIRLQMGPDLRCRDSVSDLLQTVCRQALTDLPRFEGEDEQSFRGWLFALAAHKVLDRHKFWKAAKRSTVREQCRLADVEERELRQTYSQFVTPSRDAAAREELEQVEQAFDRLTEDQREVLVLARLAGLPHREIAKRTGRSEEACRKLLNRARAQLVMLIAGDVD